MSPSTVHLPQICRQQGLVRGRHPKGLADDPTTNLLDILYGLMLLLLVFSRCGRIGLLTKSREQWERDARAGQTLHQHLSQQAHLAGLLESPQLDCGRGTGLDQAIQVLFERQLSLPFSPGMLRVTWREGTYGAVTTRSTSHVRRLSSSAIMASLHSVNATVRAIVVAFTRHCGCPELCCRRCPLNDRELP